MAISGMWNCHEVPIPLRGVNKVFLGAEDVTWNSFNFPGACSPLAAVEHLFVCMPKAGELGDLVARLRHRLGIAGSKPERRIWQSVLANVF